MFSKILKPLASLRLTVVCLSLSLILVFGGTLAQVHLGLYEVQSRYFRSWLVMWDIPGSHTSIPIFPGGWLIGGVLLVNLIAGHLTRLEFTRKKIGIWLAHLGLIVLLAGQFLTEAYQQESFVRMKVGDTRTYSEDSRKLELAIIDTTNPDHDDVVAIPESQLTKSKEIRNEKLPFAIRLKGYLANSSPARGSTRPDVLKSTQGVGRELQFAPAQVNATMDGDNSPAALVEFVGDKGAIGDWIVSPWLSKPNGLAQLSEWLGNDASILSQPQGFTFNNHTYRIEMRPTRYYTPYQLKLLEFRHDVYPGTDIPKNFSSRVRLEDPSRGESRDVLIYMNAPLRYRGDTYYQFQMGSDDSVLQVVRNPASVTPYVACTMITAGLLIHFLMHLMRFVKRSAPAIESAADAKSARSFAASARKEKH